jgi:hypothetical protein
VIQGRAKLLLGREQVHASPQAQIERKEAGIFKKAITLVTIHRILARTGNNEYK